MDPLTEVVNMQYDKLGPARLDQLRAHLQIVHSCVGGRLAVGTGCSGTDVLFQAFTRIVAKWSELFGLEFDVHHAFSVDHGACQQRFLLDNADPQYLFTSMEDVGMGGTAFDLLTEKQQLVPSCSVYACGIECDTLSPLNNYKQVGAGVVEAGDGKTGKSAQYMMSYINRHLPHLLIFECVKNLGAASKVAKDSDLDAVIRWGNGLGYLFMPLRVEALDYGSAATRGRYYLQGVRVVMPEDNFCQLPTKATARHVPDHGHV